MDIENTKTDPRYFGYFHPSTPWTQDFVYALNDRPWIFKWLFKIAIGRYAWREFVGMVETLILSGSFVTGIGYSLIDQDYHKEKPTLWGLR